MNFRETQTIYIQIAQYICEKILTHHWKANDKIPSVRELAVELEVNPNTVMRTYEFLKSMEIIIDKRGIGFFVTDQGLEKSKVYMKTEFAEKYLPLVFHNMLLLGLEPTDLEALFTKFKKQHFKK
jgi:GntR family transcriptional regulator